MTPLYALALLAAYCIGHALGRRARRTTARVEVIRAVQLPRFLAVGTAYRMKNWRGPN